MLLRIVLTFPVRLVLERVSPAYKKQLASQLASLCEDGAQILDVGCNDGHVAALMLECKPSLKIVGVDVRADRPAMIERRIYDGRKLPFPDESFDVVMANDVLHHTTDIEALLKEMVRVSKRYILIKDHQKVGLLSHLWLSLFDCIGNVSYGIPCVFNYKSLDEWKRLFNKLDLRLALEHEKLKFGFGVFQQHNPIFKLEKNRNLKKV
ncbi:methyltransferase domain-containing protein [Candidatus Woesearchaeota archaeon]|nr:methyltransferase domain-containing protein [Candidatus Woesearchaeota archaeon]